MGRRAGCIRSGLVIALGSLLLGCGAADVTSDSPGPPDPPGSGVSAEGSSGEAPAVDFVFQTSVAGGLGVFVSTDGEVTRVDEAAPGQRHKHPIWTNDGSQVAFVAEGEWDEAGDVTRPSEIWVVGPAGEEPQALIRCRCWDLNNPSWSPDGSTVAFVEYDAPTGDALTGDEPPARSRIVTLDIASGRRTTVASSAPGQLLDIPRWSPDGNRLVVSIDRFDSSGFEDGSSFGIVPSSGGPVEPMLPFEDYSYAADWSWATDTIVFSVESQEFAASDPEVSDWELFTIEPDGSDRTAITDVGPDAGLILPMWSADGSLIAATLDTTLGSLGGQMAVAVDPRTGEVTRLADPVSDYARIRPAA